MANQTSHLAIFLSVFSGRRLNSVFSQLKVAYSLVLVGLRFEEFKRETRIRIAFRSYNLSLQFVQIEIVICIDVTRQEISIQ